MTSGESKCSPFLKWAGGKGRLLSQYEPWFPPQVKAYHEPFVGSGAVFFYLKARPAFAQAWHLGDSNPELVNTFTQVRDNVEALIALLAEHKAYHSRDYFYALRAHDRQPGWQSALTPVERAARMIYLNKTCYNGLWRVNKRGQFNAPFGRYKNPPILDEARLRCASNALQGVTLNEGRFSAVVQQAQMGDLIYFDPPYVPLSRTANFTSYAAANFSMQDQEELAEVFSALSQKGCWVMLSNADAPAVHALYHRKGRIHTVTAHRAINRDAAKRGTITEVLITNY